jgi:hypothetical protein
VQRLRVMSVAVTRMPLGLLQVHVHAEAAARGPHSPDQRPNRFSVLRVSIVRMELCSTRTIGRSARRGMLGGVCVGRGVVVSMWGQTCVVTMTVTVRLRLRQWGVAEQKRCRRYYRYRGDMDSARCMLCVCVCYVSGWRVRYGESDCW